MKKCLIVCGSFYPAFKSGGPVRSLTNLVSLLGHDMSFDVVTSDKDLGDDSSMDGIKVNSWDNTFGCSKIFYISSIFFLFKNYKKIFNNKCYDVVYLNSFFDFRFTISFLIFITFGLIKTKKILLAPRGEITFGAMSLSPIKKRIYLRFFKLLKIHKNIEFHFTSYEEMAEALVFLGDVKFKLAPNMHAPMPHFREKIKNLNEINILFLSRISPKKNLLVVLESLKQLKFGTINLTIAGVVDDIKYWDKCLEIIDVLPKNINVKYLGAIDREKVPVELSKSHLFFLPTLNENYGHAIVEAMMHSNIVMLSDQTPWSEVAEYGGFIGRVNDTVYYSESIIKLLVMEESLFNFKTKEIYDFCHKRLNDNISKINQIFL
jgi:glycosyltransferase involved in cell wall biosynthesis